MIEKWYGILFKRFVDDGLAILKDQTAMLNTQIHIHDFMEILVYTNSRMVLKWISWTFWSLKAIDFTTGFFDIKLFQNKQTNLHTYLKKQQ